MSFIKTFIKQIAPALIAGSVTLSAQAAVTQVEGSAGGGIVPWALLSGGKPTVSTTWVNTGDYSLAGVAVNGSVTDRLELSYGRMSFDTAAVGLGMVNVDVIGAKYLITKMSDSMPAIAVGVQHKSTDIDAGFLTSVGAKDSGTDVYVAATKVVKAGSKKVLLNGTLRATKGNQAGILGFGSTTESGYNYNFEGSAGVFLNDSTVLGLEYRGKPDNISGLKEDAWSDLFFAFFPDKNLSMVVAYADLGDIANEANTSNGGNGGKDQRGLYLQVQANF